MAEMMENYFRGYLLAIARTYAASEELAMATVARRFHGDAAFFEKFESGSVTITLRKYDEMIRAFYSAWPRRAKWPNGGTVRLTSRFAKHLQT